MAAVTPATLLRDSAGSQILFTARFSAIDTSTWASGIQGINSYWAQTDSSCVFGVSLSGTTFTLTAGAASPLTLWVLADC